MKKSERLEQALRDAPKLMRQRDAIRQVQSEGVLRRMIAGGWLAPAVRAKKYVAFRRSDVDACVNRLLAGEMPPSLPPRARKKAVAP